MSDVLEFPYDHPEYVDRELPMRLKPGVFAAELYPAREAAKNGVLLPARGGSGGWTTEGCAAERTRPDCVIVQAVGPWIDDDDPYKPQRLWRPHFEGDREVLRGWGQVRSSAQALAQSLEPGDRVMVRPWSGTKYERAFGVEGLCFFGQTDLWEEDAVLRLVEGYWRPLTNWVVLRLKEVTEGTILVSSEKIFDVQATVIDAGPLASVRPGQQVVIADDMATQSEDDRKWLTSRWGNYSEDVWFVREVCQDGVRRVVAEIGD